MHLTGITTLHEETDPGALLGLEQVLMDSTHGEHGGDGEAVGASQTVWGREGGREG